jgi:integrase
MSINVRPFRGQEDKWEVDIRFEWPDGTSFRWRRVAPFTSPSRVKRWAEAKERELYKQGPKRKEKDKAPTLNAFAPRFIDDHLRAERRKPSTIEGNKRVLRNHLLPMFGNRRLDTITNADIQKLKARLSERNPKTVNNVLSCLSMLLKKAVEWGVIESMPCHIRMLKVFHAERAFYEFADYDHFIETAAKVDKRAELIILLAGDAGLRLGEVLALRWPNVNFNRHVVIVAESDWKGEVTIPKGGRLREVPMTARLEKALKAHRHLRGDRVLLRDVGEPFTAKVVRNFIERTERRAGREVTGRIHIFRHTFCSHLAMRGAPVRAIQELAGHADLTTTMRYMHLSPSARQAAIELLDLRRAESEPAGSKPSRQRETQGKPAALGEILETGQQTASIHGAAAKWEGGPTEGGGRGSAPPKQHVNPPRGFESRPRDLQRAQKAKRPGHPERF